MDTSEAYRLFVADALELAGAVRRDSESIARPLGQSTARWHVLSVFSNPLTVAAGARRLGLARQYVQRVVNLLLHEGLLSASSNPDHRAAALIQITAAGSVVLTKLVQESDHKRGHLMRALNVSTEELLQARNTIQKVVTMLEHNMRHESG